MAATITSLSRDQSLVREAVALRVGMGAKRIFALPFGGHGPPIYESSGCVKGREFWTLRFCPNLLSERLR